MESDNTGGSVPVTDSEWVVELRMLMDGMPADVLLPLRGCPGDFYTSISSVVGLDVGITVAQPTGTVYVSVLPTASPADCKMLKDADAAGVYRGNTRIRLISHAVVDAKIADSLELDLLEAACGTLWFEQNEGVLARPISQVVGGPEHVSTSPQRARAAASASEWADAIDGARLEAWSSVSSALGKMESLLDRARRV
ncbi:hypothetical protein ACP70R_023990 [Stipagrostis hirtigluma subsp. patula]